MPLTRYQIKHFLNIKKNTRTTAFQDAIIANDTQTFFDYVSHFGDKINLNVKVKKDLTLVMCAFISAFVSKRLEPDNMKIFNYIYNHPSLDKNMLSKDGYNLLTLAAKFGSVKYFKKFEKDGINEPRKKDVINAALKHALFHNHHSKDPFAMIDYILTQPQYRMLQNVPQTMNELCKFYYKNNKPEHIKNIFFALFNKGGIPLHNYGNSSFLIFHTIKNNDFELYKEITEMPSYHNLISNIPFVYYNEHPFYEIINNEDPRFMKHFIENKGMETLKNFPSGTFLQKIINRCNRIKDVTLFRRCIIDFGMNPMAGDVNYADINKSAANFLLTTPHKDSIIKYLDIIAEHPKFNINHTFGVYKLTFIEAVYRRYSVLSELTDVQDQINQEIDWLSSKKFNFLHNGAIPPLLIMSLNADEKNYHDKISHFDFSDFSSKKYVNYLFFSLNKEHLNYIVSQNYSRQNQRYSKMIQLLTHFYHKIAQNVNLFETNKEGYTILDYLDNYITANPSVNCLPEIRETIYYAFINQQKNVLKSNISSVKTKEFSRL